MEESNVYNESKNSILNLTGQASSSSDVSPLEQEVLDEYERLVKNMNDVSSKISFESFHALLFTRRQGADFDFPN
jgi:hypothetical protein